MKEQSALGTGRLRFAEDRRSYVTMAMDRLEKNSPACSMDISAVKTKLVFKYSNSVKNTSVDTQVDKQRLETVRSFKYLDALVTVEESKPQTLIRITQSAAAMTTLKTTWNSRNITTRSKIRLVLSVA
ncbi:hypothetical protein ElyMa_006952100 [Elysia marginata]|uniref:Reverse transcriptase domain-containing protein n=1 Tax=Elysia marginata TaxID=1093978 RepID=A0AAV4JI64_9GAST|nr:hypothetical protein ElyMa_006952100 [Elysia marginata]